MTRVPARIISLIWPTLPPSSQALKDLRDSPQLIDLPIHRSPDPQIHRSTDHPIHRSPDHPIHRSPGRPTPYFSAPPRLRGGCLSWTNSPIPRATFSRSTDHPISRFTDLPIHRSPDDPITRSTDLPITRPRISPRLRVSVVDVVLGLTNG
jgi:hypothetical protein